MALGRTITAKPEGKLCSVSVEGAGRGTCPSEIFETSPSSHPLSTEGKRTQDIDSPNDSAKGRLTAEPASGVRLWDQPDQAAIQGTGDSDEEEVLEEQSLESVDVTEWFDNEGESRKWLLDSFDLLGGSQSREASKYELLEKVGEGAFGVVYKALRIADGATLAVKKVILRQSNCDIPQEIAREVSALQKVKHSNVIELLDHFHIGSNLVLVFPYCPHNLSQVIGRAQRPLSEGVIKGWLLQILQGVAACHAAGVMHRDLKPANLLIADDGTLKLGDFGLACEYSSEEGRQYTHAVATRWYRAPELLFGARIYKPAVDMWAVGCIFAELLALNPLFPGDNDIDQLNRVVQVLGSPEESRWPGVSSLPDFHKIIFNPCLPKPWHQILPDVADSALLLLSKLVNYDANKRLSASAALADEYFTLEPQPLPPSELPLPICKGVSIIDEDWDLFG